MKLTGPGWPPRNAAAVISLASPPPTNPRQNSRNVVMKMMALAPSVESATLRSPIKIRRNRPSAATAITSEFGIRRVLTSPYPAATKRAMPESKITDSKSSSKLTKKYETREAGVRAPASVSRCGLQRGVDREEVAPDGIAENCNGTDAQDGDQADEHAVLDQSRALIVLSKARKKVTHGKKIIFRVGIMTGLAMHDLSQS